MITSYINNYEDGTLSISGLTGRADLIHASYVDGVLADAEILNAENGTQNITAADGDKFLLWDNVNSMKPLHRAVTVRCWNFMTGTLMH